MNAMDLSFVRKQEQRASLYCDYPFPATEQLLIEGGDTRIALSNSTGANKYGCRPNPNSNISAFGSATASTISETSFFAANQLRNRLAKSVARNSAAEVYADEINRIRQELGELCGLRKDSGVDIIFAASGTDVHLIASQLAEKDDSAPLRMLMVDTAETGNGVTAALSGRHFGGRAALGDTVTQGAVIGKKNRGQVISISLRQADGTPRPGYSIDADFEQQVSNAAIAGERILLTMVDVSKTGMIAPSVECAINLRRLYPDTVEVLVDACQYRISPSTLKAYLAQGFMVGITGSKFVSGPSFSGALLVPAPLAKSMRQDSRLAPLQEYSARSDWPVDWVMAKSLEAIPNFGLLLRWEGALRELRAFRSVSNIVTMHFLRDFGEAIKQRMANDPIFELLPVPELQRSSFPDTPSWDNIQTIFPFLLCHPEVSNRKILLSSEEMVLIYRALQVDADSIQLAQPVDCGRRNGKAISALRMCVSSRMIVEATQNNGKNYQQVIDRAIKALNKIAQHVRAKKLGISLSEIS